MEETAPSTTNDGYKKKSLWQWLVIYFVLGIIIYAGVYFFVLSKNTGYNSKSTQPYPSPSAVSVSPTSRMMNSEATVTLGSVNKSGESGTAILSEENGQTKVTINLTGFTKDVEQPAHIH